MIPQRCAFLKSPQGNLYLAFVFTWFILIDAQMPLAIFHGIRVGE